MKVTMLFVVSLCQLLILWKSYHLSGNLLDLKSADPDRISSKNKPCRFDTPAQPVLEY
jgi:hypothetical protein